MPKKSQSITVTVRLRRMHDYWGTPIPWHYSRDALIRCLRGIASRRDNVLQRSCVLLRGQAQVMTHIAIDHVQEGACQLVFKTRIRFAEAKPLVLCLIVAKDSGRVSRLADGEHRNLVALHARRPESVVLPLRGGYLGLEPSRGAPRKIYVYCADWLSGFHELGVNRRMNFFINEKPFHHFDRATTVKIKKQIVDLCMALYDEDRGRGIETPLIGAGDIVITRPRGGRGLELKLIAARKMISGLTREACLKMYKDYRGEWGGKTFRLSN